MKLYILLLFVSFCSFAASGQPAKPLIKPIIVPEITAIEATTKDGKPVILKSDKTWEYKTEPPVKETIIQNDNLFKTYVPQEVKRFAKSLADDIKKTEFETEDQYQKRIAKFVEEKQFNGTPIKQIAFVGGIDNLRYSAESQTFTLDVYRAGELTIVERTQGLYLPTSLRKEFQMSADKAKKLKPLMELVIFGFPVGETIFGVEIVPTQIIIRNKNTGEIYLNDSVGNFLDKAKRSDSLSESVPNSESYPRNSITPTYSPKTVQVDGYYRKDGTYVKPHTRSAPRRKN